MCDRMGWDVLEWIIAVYKQGLDYRDTHAFLRSIVHTLNVQGFV